MEKIQNFNNILNSFGIKAVCVDYQNIDNYFFYDLKLQPSAKVHTINKYIDEISLMLKAPCKPSMKILHNQGVVRLEYAMPRSEPLMLFDYFTNHDVPKGNLICLLGQSVNGNRMWMDLADNPHMIISGTTGSGKSTLLHNIIANLFNYNKVKLFLMDPKNIEFSEYQNRIQNNVNVSYSYDECLKTMADLIMLMNDRYDMIRSGLDPKKLPYAVLIIDEFADLIMQDKNDEFYNSLCCLAQKCRAARISIVLATQRPSVNIINGTIKANFPARIACRVASYVDSKVVLDIKGAENLLGKGDALVKDNFKFLERFQVAYTTQSEVCYHFGT